MQAFVLIVQEKQTTVTRRDDVYQVILDYADRNVGNMPSQREIMGMLKRRGMDLSLSSIRYHLTKLEAERKLERRSGKLVVAGANWGRPARRRRQR
jgi:repressor of nif and glnA expression